MSDFGPAVPIRLDGELDRPLYRIFPLWHFEDMLRVRRLALVSPNLWEDPREDIPASIVMQRPDHKQKELNGYLHPARCQCWSFECESDSLLRAYSRVTIDPLHKRNCEPRNEGVMVRTTARKLSKALTEWTERATWGKFYLGRVQYLAKEEATQMVVNTLAGKGPVEIGRGEHRAQSLLLKRQAFAHEDEVRLIWVCDDKRDVDKVRTISSKKSHSTRGLSGLNCSNDSSAPRHWATKEPLQSLPYIRRRFSKRRYRGTGKTGSIPKQPGDRIVADFLPWPICHQILQFSDLVGADLMDDAAEFFDALAKPAQFLFADPVMF